MTKKRSAQTQAERTHVADITKAISLLADLTVSQLADKYAEVFGQKSKSRNKDFLRKKIAWRIQELAEGGLSATARRRITELSEGAEDLLQAGAVKRKQRAAATDSTIPLAPRDQRLPAVGTILRRAFQGQDYEVTVLDDGFQYKGAPYKSLSRIAREITGTNWNGFLFFGLTNGSKEVQ